LLPSSDQPQASLQVYLRSRRSLSARAAAQQAFATHCGGDLVRAAYGLTGEPSTLYKPAAWPHMVDLKAWLGGSGLARLSRDSSVLEGHLWQLTAAGQPQGGSYSSGALVYALTGLSHSASRHFLFPRPPSPNDMLPQEARLQKVQAHSSIQKVVAFCVPVLL
jgi:hypothetical protein